MNTYFVTGVTGVVGSALLPVLLKDPTAHARVLVRAETEEALRLRIDVLKRHWSLDGADARFVERVHFLRGDVTQPRFGLASDVYEELASATSCIVHAAGAVRMNLPLEMARRSAVGGAEQVLTLAEKARSHLRKVEFVSTVGVGGYQRTVPERFLNGYRRFHNTYEQAKSEAEDLVRRACERGLPITVHRPSMVVGDSQSGRVIHDQVFYHLCMFLSGRPTYGLSPPLAHARLDIVPVDSVARTIALSSTERRWAGRVLHCSSGEDAIPLLDLSARVRRLLFQDGYELPRMWRIPNRAFGALARLGARFSRGDVRRKLQTLPVFLSYLESIPVFHNHETRRLLLAKGGTPLPHFRVYIDQVLRRQFADHSHEKGITTCRSSNLGANAARYRESSPFMQTT